MGGGGYNGKDTKLYVQNVEDERILYLTNL